MTPTLTRTITPLRWIPFAAVAAAALVVGGLGGWAYGQHAGRADGRALERGEVNGQVVQQMGEALTSHRELIDQASAASRRMRAAVAAQEALNQSQKQETRDALLETAADRVDCVFPDRVLDNLAAARARAAQAATGGVLGAVSVQPAGPDQQPR
jgi:hypothetical protein